MLLQEQLENRNIYLCKLVLIQLFKKKEKETKAFNAVLQIIMIRAAYVQRIRE